MDKVQMLIIVYYVVIKGMVLNKGLWHGNFLKKARVEMLNDVCFLFWIPYIIDKKHA